MDNQHFDDLTRSLAHGVSRRRLFKGLAGLLLGGVASLPGAHGGMALICRAPGTLCAKDGQCCSGACDPASHRCVCPAGQIACGGTCIAACAALDQCHVAGACDPATGKCTNPPAADGTACDDGNACTQTDTCQGGICTGGNPVVCATSDQCHDIGICNPATGQCSNPAKPDGTPCDDGNRCTQSDSCQAGACVGGNPVVCTASDHCHAAGSCDPATGSCSNPAKPDGSECDDGDPCTTNDACMQGGCTAGQQVACPTCQICSGGACVSDSSQIGQSCGNGKICQGGQCVAACLNLQAPCTSDFDCCQTGGAARCLAEKGSPVCCRPGQGSCTSSLDCCGELLCSASSVCCVPLHSACATDFDCCDHNTCLNGTCVTPCLPLLSVCVNEAQCCQSPPTTCDHGLNIPETVCCRPPQGSCVADNDCCGVFNCHSGLCCHSKGSDCGADSDCCSNYCNFLGVCDCKTALLPCNENRQCCSGLSCSPDVFGTKICQ